MFLTSFLSKLIEWLTKAPRATEESSDSEPSVKGKPTAPAAKVTPAPPPAAKKPAVVPAKKKWEGEDEEESDPVSDWEESSEEESEEEVKPVVAPPKKKGTLKAKLAEKEAAKANKKDGSTGSDDYDSDAVLDPREKARLDKERELKADLNNAADLLGAAALGGTSSSELDSLISFQPRTKEDFVVLSDRIIEFIIKKHHSKPLYHTFVEHHARALAAPLKDVEVRKVASGLTTLANEKQKEQRDKASGKKKPKGASKPGLGGTKSLARAKDTELYDEALDDFGTNADDFM
ncbi:Eukaryotic translation initiation factor 3 subunit J [Psilocybe cubensis]|uniref:Eukaryotic translation initiation factor 3 subunit J n=2 Tax=Psilocybe cubensis TaxID=181762 RepID=A0ACB8H0Q9_PSICU|nr:Eukaryotic translation initiation factor 3 subunit J [Psilocybe cubensis]KAH9481227.1 Eukaryotic translation initiation factor 3 subunit J [Psilocybe cubensis]